VPNDQAIRSEMMRFVHNYAHIYSMYNFDFDPEPGSVQHKIDQRISRVGGCWPQCSARALWDVAGLGTCPSWKMWTPPAAALHGRACDHWGSPCAGCGCATELLPVQNAVSTSIGT